jgi:uncharacterized protein (DUF433 family)
MVIPASPYIDTEDGACRIAGTRVGLDCIIHEHQIGRTPEQIIESFPTVTLAQAYGAMAHYLENKQIIDDFFAEVYRRFEEKVHPLNETNPELFARLEAARQQMGSKRR